MRSQDWPWFVFFGLIICYTWWPSDSVDPESESYKAGYQSGYERGYRAGAAYVCRHLDETATGIAADYRRRNFC